MPQNAQLMNSQLLNQWDSYFPTCLGKSSNPQAFRQGGLDEIFPAYLVLPPGLALLGDQPLAMVPLKALTKGTSSDVGLLAKIASLRSLEYLESFLFPILLGRSFVLLAKSTEHKTQ